MALTSLYDTQFSGNERHSPCLKSSQSLNELDHFESGKPCAASMDLSQRADSTIGWIDELPNAMNQGL